MKKILYILLLFFFFFPFSAHGEEHTLPEEIDILEEASKGASEFETDFSFKEEVLKNLNGQSSDGTSIFTKIISLFISSVKAGMNDSLKIMMAIFIFSIILKFIPSGSAASTAFFATYAVVFTMALFIFDKAASVANTVIEEMNFFVKGAVPVMCTLSVPAGKFASSAGTAAIIGGICAVCEGAAKFLMPLVSMMAAISAANNLSPEISLKGLEITLRRVIMWSIGIIMTIFVSLLKIRGITGQSLDNVTGKTIKFAVGNMVPVVGGIISDSLDNIISYSSAIKGSCGAVGILALIYITLPPIIKIAGMLISLRLTGIITSPVADGRINSAIDSFAEILGTVLIITVMVSVLFITAMGSLAV